ncbi:MAG: fibronectin type III domain-containing protein [Opitutales bacterium]
MATFPTAESDVVDLARRVAQGLETHADLFPTPPLSPGEINIAVDALLKARQRQSKAQRELDAARAERETVAEQLAERTKLVLNYAETHSAYDDSKLRLIGWEGRKPKKLLPPGPPRALELVRVQDGIVELDWKKPSDGGDAQSYRIEAREGDGRWTLKGFSLHSDCVLHNLEPGRQYEVRVIAVNKMGDSEASDIVDVIF